MKAWKAWLLTRSEDIGLVILVLAAVLFGFVLCAGLH